MRSGRQCYENRPNLKVGKRRRQLARVRQLIGGDGGLTGPEREGRTRERLSQRWGRLGQREGKNRDATVVTGGYWTLRQAVQDLVRTSVQPGGV